MACFRRWRTGSVVTHYELGVEVGSGRGRRKGKGGQSSCQLCRNAKVGELPVGTMTAPTHQRRGDALVEPAEALLTRDGRERMQCGAVLDI